MVGSCVFVGVPKKCRFFVMALITSFWGATYQKVKIRLLLNIVAGYVFLIVSFVYVN